MTIEEGRVAELWRYPVKSMLGEAPGSVDVDARGVVGDRRFAVCDAEGKLGSGKNTRRMRRMDGLFAFAASLSGGAGVPSVTTPDGRTLPVLDPGLDDLLSQALGIAVRVQAEGRISHFDDSPIHLVTRASLDRLRALPGSRIDGRRFRANVVLDVPGEARVEETWRGRTIAIGAEVVLRVSSPTERCVMTTMPQADLPDDPAILRTVAREWDACFGVYAEVLAPGRVACGDRVRVMAG